MNTRAPESSASRADLETEAPLSSSVSSHPELSPHEEGQHRAPEDPIAPTGPQPENSITGAFWTATSDPKAPCDNLLRSQAELLKAEGADTCELYPLWIAYLILETALTPACDLEPTFSLAAEALQREALCGPGHAFLCAYYLKKGLLDRSQSFLDQALRKAPDDPWVRLVEAVFYEQGYYDDQRAISILADLNRQDPSFSLAGYILGKAHIRQEEYSEANAAFESLKKDARGQIAFWRIRRALSSLELIPPDQAEEKAEALLTLSRAFTALRDYPMAQDLYRWVLEEMPGGLPKAERMAAYCELGRIYEDRGESSSAYDAYRNALEIDPEYLPARLGIQALLPDQVDRS
jgi:tetratricopeptide (TPR) repeat protein